MQIHETLINLDTGTRFSEETYEAGETTRGEVYRNAAAQFGRCTGKVFVGEGTHVGWTFLSRDRYEDTGDTYLREAWVTIGADSAVAPF